MNSAGEIRSKYFRYFEERGHTLIPRAALIPREDPTTLFTGSGMQPLIPYLLGADHPAGDRLVDSQTCFRSEDVDEVGDNRHTTFFEMLGNWGLGSYFKAEQLPWFFGFAVGELGVDPNRLYVSVFSGAPAFDIPPDEESREVWKRLFTERGIDPTVAAPGTSERASAEGTNDARINLFDESKCWWSRVGSAAGMPVGEPGGPDSEVFYRFDDLEHDTAFGEHCHIHCDCGRYVEIGNSVFMEYQRTEDGFVPLPQRNVDFGGGLERLAMAVDDTPDIFRVGLLRPIVEQVAALSGASYEEKPTPIRVIADHMRSIVFCALDGLEPSNTTQGYVMRRFARRAIRQGHLLGIESHLLAPLVDTVVACYSDAYPELVEAADRIKGVLDREETLFRSTLGRGVREFPKVVGGRLTGEVVFTLFDTYGFPPELSVEEAERTGVDIEPEWQDSFQKLMAEQRERSRTAAQGMFKGGLADHTEETTRLHTATHLLYKALRTVLGDHVVQRGSNITGERLRFDFSHPQKVTPEELAEVARIVNDQIERDWPMGFRELPTGQAFEEGALGAFGDKYGETVKVYTAGDPDGEWFSKEICGGPHVEHTGVLGSFRILKEESSSAGVRRIRAVLEQSTAA